MNYRYSCIKYNMRRQEILSEAERAVEVSCAFINSIRGTDLIVKQASVQFNYDFIEAVKLIITAFANAQWCVPCYRLQFTFGD
jgi:hypothetical protein